MRKVLTIVALGCLLLLTGGYHLLYQCQLAEIKSAVKSGLARLKQSDLTQLVLSPAEVRKLDWEDESEFCYGGRMYDVVDVEKKTGRTVYWCLADEKETALLDAYLQMQNSSSDKDPSHSLFKLLKVPFLPGAFRWIGLQRHIKIKPSQLCFVRISMRKGAVLTPPPKVC